MLHFADYILAPNCTRLGKFTQKKIGFEGFKQSAYLRPEDFKPDRRVLEKYSLTENKYFVIRLVALNASHDIGKTGITNKLLDKIITQLNSHGTVYISSERELPPNYKNLKLKREPSDILHVINFSTFFICDSQTMSAEAAFLGTPYIRFNDFVDKISYLNELELKYKLGFGIKTTDELNLFQTINSLLEQANLQAEWDKRKANMLKNTINLNAFMTELFIFHSNKTSN
jgi:predicted glycosyltransferase